MYEKCNEASKLRGFLSVAPLRSTEIIGSGSQEPFARSLYRLPHE